MTEQNSSTNRNLRSSFLLFLLAISCGSSDDDRAVRIFKGAAIKEGIVSGFVVDDESEVPVAAEVLVGGTPVRAQADGSFQASAVPGRVRVEVRSDGYLKTFRDVVSGDKSVPMPFKVAHRAPKMPVGPAGGTVMFRGATLVVAPNTFAAETPVALTFLSRIRVAAVSATPQFIDQTGVPRRAVALVDVDADAAAMVGMRARVPVPADATMESVSGFTIDSSGNWTTAVAPASVSGGFADFIFNGNNQIGVAVDVRKADGNKLGYVVTERGGSGKAQGDVIEGGMEIVVGNRPAAFVDQQGSRVEMAPGTRARVEVPAGETPAAASRAPYSGEVTVNAGRARIVVPPPTAGAQKSIKLAMHGTAGKYNVTGTALTLAACVNGTDFLDFLEVVEGSVEVEVGTGTDKKTDAVNAGESALLCTNCKESPTPICTEAPAPDGGMSTMPPTQGLDGSTGMASLEGGVPIDATPATADAGTPPDAVIVPADAAPAGADGATMPPPPPPPADAGAPDAAMADAQTPPDAFGGPFDTASLPPPVDAAPLPPPVDAAPPPPPPPPMAVLAISPTSQDFSAATVRTAGAMHTFGVTNVGTLASGPLSVQSMGEFAVTANGCTNFLLPGGTCTVTLQFMPQGVGVRSGLLKVEALPGGAPTSSLTGTGFAMAPPPPPADAAAPEPDVAPPAPDLPPPLLPARLVMQPESRDFGDVMVEDTSDVFFFTVQNVGEEDSGTVTFDRTGPFALPENTCAGTTLPPGDYCRFRVVFEPNAAGPAQGMVVATPSAANGIAGSATLTGTGHNSPLIIKPPSYDFGNIDVGSSTKDPIPFDIMNIGDLDLTSFGFFTEPRLGAFRLVGEPSCPNPFPAHSVCTVRMVFAPTQAGPQEGRLRARSIPDGGAIIEGISDLKGFGVSQGGGGGQGGGQGGIGGGLGTGGFGGQLGGF